MRILLLLLCLAQLPVLSWAQKDPRLATGSSYLARPNELGINLAPAAVLLLKGEPSNPRFALTYKRLFETSKRQGAIRVGLAYIHSYSPGQLSPFESSLLEEKMDSLEIRLEQHDRILNLGGFVGVEYRSRVGNVWITYGTDVFVRSITQRSEVFRKNYVVENNCLDGDCDPKEVLSVRTQTGNSASVQTGLYPFIGGLFRVNRRLTLNIETGFQLGYEFGTSVSSINKQLAVVSANGSIINQPYWIRELGLYYRF